MPNRSLISPYYNYKPFVEWEWKEDPLIRTSGVLLFFALIATFYFNHLMLIGVILYLIAILLPIYPLFEYLARKQAHKPKPLDADIDETFFYDLENTVKKKAILKLEVEGNITEEQILMIPGPVFWKKPGISDSSIKRERGTDGIYRYTMWEVTVMVLAEKYISIYDCTFNWLTNSVSDEHTCEYFYNDIIAVRTASSPRDRELISGGKVAQVQVLKLQTLSGDAIEVELNRTSLNPQRIIGQYTDVALKTLRRKLREKKYPEMKMEVVRPTEDGQSSVVETLVSPDTSAHLRNDYEPAYIYRRRGLNIEDEDFDVDFVIDSYDHEQEQEAQENERE